MNNGSSNTSNSMTLYAVGRKMLLEQIEKLKEELYEKSTEISHINNLCNFAFYLSGVKIAVITLVDDKALDKKIDSMLNETMSRISKLNDELKRREV